MGQGPSYKEIVLLCTLILAFGAGFAAYLGVPYGTWTHWPPDLQWLGYLLARRGTAGTITAGILLIGFLMYRALEKDDPALEARPPRWLFVLFCLGIWACGAWIFFRWGLGSPGPDRYDFATSMAARADGRHAQTLLALLAVVGVVIALIVFPRPRK